MRKLSRVLLILLAFGLVGLMASALVGVWIIHGPVRLTAPMVNVSIPSGSGAHQIAQELRKAGVLVHETGFVLYSRLRGTSGALKSGDYLFEEGSSLVQVLEKLEKGESLSLLVTIPEGFRASQVADRLVSRGVIPSVREFMDAVSDADLAKSLDVPAESMEGFLYPETYSLSKGLKSKDVITLMVKRFFEILPDDYAQKAEAAGLSFYEAVILASIVEKEAMSDVERPIISGVFHNRLKRGWPLQADPCVRFACQNFNRRITQNNLRFDSPYNTYLYTGLPPGPICSPGEKSLMASALPAQVDYLFFVSMNNGRHFFSSTLDAHNKAVWQYQVLKEVGT